MAGGGIIVPPGVIRESTSIADQWANNERPGKAARPFIGSVESVGPRLGAPGSKERQSRATDVRQHAGYRTNRGRGLQ